MQDATAAQTQSAPQASPTAGSYVALRQQPSFRGDPTMGSPNTTSSGSAPQVQARWGYKGSNTPYAVSAPDTAGNPTSGEPIQGRIQQGSRIRFKFNLVGQQSAGQAADQATDTNKQPHTARGQQTYMPSSNNNSRIPNNYSQTSRR